MPRIILSIAFALSLFALSAAAASAYVDLEPVSITVSPAAPALNEPCKVTIKVDNKGNEDIGNVPALKSVNVNFQDFTQTAITYPTGIGAGKSASYVVSGYFGRIYNLNVGFGVDDHNSLAEMDETNNYTYIKLQIVEPYDVKVEAIEVRPSAPAPGQDALITVKLKNNGYLPIRTSNGVSENQYDLSDFVVKEKTEPTYDSEHEIASGAFFYYRYFGHFPAAGEKELSFEIDPNNKLKEKDEANNSGTKKITLSVLADLDLGLDSISVEPAKPLIDQSGVVIKVTVKNTGKISLISDKGLRHDKDLSVFPVIDEEIKHVFGEFKVQSFSAQAYPSWEKPLDPGKTYVYTYTGVFYNLPGERQMSFSINTNNRLKEATAANNALTKTVYVYRNAAERDAIAIGSYAVDFYSATSARLSWLVTQEADSQAWYKQNDFTGWIDTGSTKGTKFERVIKGLRTGYKYDWKIYAKRNQEERTVDKLTFTTPAASGIGITSGPWATASGTSDYVFEWTTDILGDAAVYYRTAGPSAPLGTGAKDYKNVYAKGPYTSHRVGLTKLAKGNYEYYVVSRSSQGYKAQSAAGAFAVGDVTPPPVATGDSPQGENNNGATGDSPQGEDSPLEGGKGDESSAAITNSALYSSLKGKIVLTVEKNGEAYYIHPQKKARYYLGRPDDAFRVMREQGIGIATANLNKIAVGFRSSTGVDTDGDGLSDIFEDAIGTDKGKKDTDNDGFSDGDEIKGGYSPLGAGQAAGDQSFAAAHKGKIFLQVEGKGEAWYVSPADNKRYFLGRPADAFAVMRALGLGISNENFGKL